MFCNVEDTTNAVPRSARRRKWCSPLTRTLPCLKWPMLGSTHAPAHPNARADHELQLTRHQQLQLQLLLPLICKKVRLRGAPLQFRSALCTSLLQQTLSETVRFSCLPQFSTWLSELGIFLGLQMWCKDFHQQFIDFFKVSCVTALMVIVKSRQKSSWNN